MAFSPKNTSYPKKEGEKMTIKKHSSKEFPPGNEKPRVYQKPLFEKTPGMNFTAKIWKKFRGACGCMQCSACHGCA